jgi:hypothetical protein
LSAPFSAATVAVATLYDFSADACGVAGERAAHQHFGVASIALIARSWALISLAGFSGLQDTVAAFCLTVAIGAGCTTHGAAPVQLQIAKRYRHMNTRSAALVCRPVQSIHGTSIGVVAGNRTVAIANLGRLNKTIAA